MVSMVNNIFEAQCQATPYKVIGWDKWEEEDLKYSLYLLLKLAQFGSQTFKEECTMNVISHAANS